VASKFNLPSFNSLSLAGGPLEWVSQILKVSPKREKRKNLGILVTFWWMIWKERNKRIFEDKEVSSNALAVQILKVVVFNLIAWNPHTAYPS
jgi:hypothetical protein